MVKRHEFYSMNDLKKENVHVVFDSDLRQGFWRRYSAHGSVISAMSIDEQHKRWPDIFSPRSAFR